MGQGEPASEYCDRVPVLAARTCWTLTPENWSGRVEVVSALDGRVTNNGVARYGQLEGRHLDPVGPRTFGSEVIALKVQTRQSNLYIS